MNSSSRLPGLQSWIETLPTIYGQWGTEASERSAFLLPVKTYDVGPWNVAVNSIVYHIIFFIILLRILWIIAESLVHHKRLKLSSIFKQRLLVHLLLLLSVLTRLIWFHYLSFLQLFIPRPSVVDFSDLFNRWSVLLLFAAFCINIAVYIKVNIRTLNPTRRKLILFAAHLFAYGVTAVVMGLQLVVNVFWIISPMMPTEGSLVFDFNLLVLIGYWFFMSVAFTWFSGLYSLRVVWAIYKAQLSATRKTFLIVRKGLFLLSKMVLFDFALLLRLFAFSYRPVTGKHMWDLVYPAIFYTIPDTMTIIGLLINFKDAPGKSRRGRPPKARPVEREWDRSRPHRSPAQLHGIAEAAYPESELELDLEPGLSD
ncbi:hypothetical protein J8273_8796 [Carpediemonas membranifera]|uniref:THH1/TOM1/TOM3 domain-containing protein n=1 Tax=Carpediemonas membranifera TaxID=201153 RepID=A0A8J6APH7_9EUKA|nr:hypothetical protein J8273_8796 [Carpediemonas membranifera]|eukprot:KAG9389503.1 hypothetical protein J8273_8796 [Carpediemonas membranifera]